LISNGLHVSTDRCLSTKNKQLKRSTTSYSRQSHRTVSYT